MNFCFQLFTHKVSYLINKFITSCIKTNKCSIWVSLNLTPAAAIIEWILSMTMFVCPFWKWNKKEVNKYNWIVNLQIRISQVCRCEESVTTCNILYYTNVYKSAQKYVIYLILINDYTSYYPLKYFPCKGQFTCIFHILVSSSMESLLPRKSTIFLILSQYCTWSILPTIWEICVIIFCIVIIVIFLINWYS